eukprot:scaffold3396_cov176-Amphora_coffeaeformis.AAC.9
MPRKAKKIKNNDDTIPAPEKMYWIQCSDGSSLIMGQNKLEVLLEAMPIFRCLLMGHPNMARKPFNTRSDGTEILEIPPELDVKKKSFLLLIDSFFETKPLACFIDDGDDNKDGDCNDNVLEDLRGTLNTLGGCEVLEKRLAKVHPRYNPLTPGEDVNDEYIWDVVEDYQRPSHENLHKRGFSFASIFVDSDGIAGRFFYFRKKKVKGEKSSS